MASSHNQVIVDVGSENRPLMLEKWSYIPWSSRFMRYIDGKKEYGKILKNSIENDPYQMKEIEDHGNLDGHPPIPPFKRIQEEADLTNKACKTEQAMWQRVKRLMQDTDLSKQGLTSRLLDEFDKFKGMSRESRALGEEEVVVEKV
ncbi:hypothetical protein Tco_1439011 [Tanacetum coccineum]